MCFQEESVKFNMEWKWPCALFYVKKKFNSDYKIQGNLMQSFDTPQLGRFIIARNTYYRNSAGDIPSYALIV